MSRGLRLNGGLITLGELEKLGFTSEEIKGLVGHGALRRVHRRVYADARAPLSDDAHLKAALLAFNGRRPWLSGIAAAMGWKLEALSLARLEVTVVARSTPEQRPGLRVRSLRTAPHPSEIRTRNGLRLSSIPRMLIESAASGATSDRLHWLIEQAVRRSLLDVTDLGATLERNRGQRGTQLVKATCAEYLPDLDRKSGLERAFDRWLTAHPEIPEPRRNVHLGPWELDCFWPDHDLVLELDGRAYHSVIEDIDRDRRKDAWLQLHGKRVLRVSDSRFKRDKAGVYRDLLALLAVAGNRGDEHAA